MDMSALIFPIILLGVLLIFFAVFLIVTKKQHKKASINNNNNKDLNKKNNGKKDDSASVSKEDVFKFMEFDRILDNMIVQNDGTKFTMAVKCKGINYDLMSDMEQLAVEEGFITFLNTLRYPIQLYVQAQNIDLKSAINTYKQNANYIKDEYEEINKQYVDILDQFDAKENEIKTIEEKRNKVLNVYEYASDIINYVEKLSLNKSLLQRNFYVLVSYFSSEITASSSFSKEEIINICYNELLTRAQSIISGLSACSVSGVILTSNELADLLYAAYNRDDKGLLSVKEAIQSGFYRLYSTSEDVLFKKQEKMLEKINEEAELKALESVKKAIEEGNYIPATAEKLDVLDQISKTAAEIVKKEDIPSEVKTRAKEILVDDYVENKKKILAEEELNNEDIENKDKEKNQKEENKEEIKNDSENNLKEEIKNGETQIINEELLDNRLGFDNEADNQVEKTKNNTKSEENSEDDDLII